MELLRFAWEGLHFLIPDASQMPPQPQAPKCFPNGSQMLPKWHPNVSQVASKNAVWGLVLGSFYEDSIQTGCKLEKERRGHMRECWGLALGSYKGMCWMGFDFIWVTIRKLCDLGC